MLKGRTRFLEPCSGPGREDTRTWWTARILLERECGETESRVHESAAAGTSKDLARSEGLCWSTTARNK